MRTQGLIVRHWPAKGAFPHTVPGLEDMVASIPPLQGMARLRAEDHSQGERCHVEPPASRKFKF